MSTALSIGAILPCRNNLEELRDHVEHMRQWWHLVEQIVVVDSSDDGSLEFLRSALPPERTEFHSLPPGLYQAWNHAVRQVTSKYCYFSTVGDTIRPGELQRLCALAEETSADVVAAPPLMLDAEGLPAQDEDWPAHHLCRQMKAEGIDFLQVDPGILGILCCALSPKSLIGSSASNIYLTKCLQENPWPEDFGHAGDSAWLSRNHARLKFVFLAQETGIFRLTRAHVPGNVEKEVVQASRIREEALLAGALCENTTPSRAALNNGAMQATHAWQSKLWQFIGDLSKATHVFQVAEQQRDYIQILEKKVKELENRPWQSLLHWAHRGIKNLLEPRGLRK